MLFVVLTPARHMQGVWDERAVQARHKPALLIVVQDVGVGKVSCGDGRTFAKQDTPMTTTEPLTSKATGAPSNDV